MLFFLLNIQEIPVPPKLDLPSIKKILFLLLVSSIMSAENRSRRPLKRHVVVPDEEELEEKIEQQQVTATLISGKSSVFSKKKYAT